MALLWTPDTCKGGACQLSVTQGQTELLGAFDMCPHHQRIFQADPDPARFLARVLETNRAKNYACYEVGKERGILTGEVEWSIDDDDIVRIKGDGNADRKARAASRIAARADIKAGKVILDDG